MRVKTEFTAGLPKLWVYGTDTKACEYRVNYSDIDKTVEPRNKTFIDTQSQNQIPKTNPHEYGNGRNWHDNSYLEDVYS